MKLCPRCGEENSDRSLFCEHCGYEFAKSETSPKRSQGANLQETAPISNYTPNPQKSSVPKWAFMIAGLALLAVVVGVGFAMAGRNNNEAQLPATSSTSSTIDTSKYDEIIAEAKELTINGDYKKSNLKLSRIPASDLGKSEFSAIADEVDDLTEKNEEGLKQEEDKEATQKAQEKDRPAVRTSGSTSGFSGDYAKWANTYYFYYSQTSQRQTALTIGANGSVTQKNVNGTQYFGKATITSASGDVLSYETNEQYPTEMPDTKLINPNVQITVTWDGGGTQIYYGYISYSSRLALTDGVSKNDGVNEVWIS
ncbi:zinc-ribbon domain-containing protein [Candidatus Enterococcus murrayae]|uniref:Zinc-ribbon domain-containing protein n=1 Tax=Candidatus Enterococcus murrayae TaxID=2815321 RepID=A0ABS3HH98_9ENTE|nr:zinc ribbon domain-containing protein [Enterococcus sp. MJM16]MBO0451983.1 zinc-ribbon domain-containing protein [Enterococcus sp. MJM16]